MRTKAQLVLEDGTTCDAVSFGAPVNTAGELVFATGMMGYHESLTDPSYRGQILVLTYPLIGNYGVPDKTLWESSGLMVAGLIVSDYIDTPSHFQSTRTLAAWFQAEQKPLIEVKDTRFLTQKLREKGTMLGKIIVKGEVSWYDPNKDNLVAQVATKTITLHKPTRDASNKMSRYAGAPVPGVKYPSGASTLASGNSRRRSNNRAKTILLIDCGAKLTIQRALVKRGVRVITIPWNLNPFTPEGRGQLEQAVGKAAFEGVVISNGPGDPTRVRETITTVRTVMAKSIPILGICLGHQILALAAGGKTQKLRYGHRSQNQPCLMSGSRRCVITTQNHGFAVSSIPSGFAAWFTNANDNTNEGMRHKTKPFMSVQFHPEATPGPLDAEWIFDHFLQQL